MPSDLDPQDRTNAKRVVADSELAKNSQRRRGGIFLALPAAGVVLGLILLSLLTAGSEDDSPTDEGVFEEPDDLAVPPEHLPVTTTQTTTTTSTATGTSSEVSFTEVDWTMLLDDPDFGPGVHSLTTIAEVRPLTPGAIEDLFGFLVWDGETVVDLCRVEVREVGSGYVHIGDGYQTTEGCPPNPYAMQEAFDLFGPPDIACVGFMANGSSYKYCASLNSSHESINRIPDSGSLDTPIQNPLNGHFYEAVFVPGGITWEDAKTAAEARSLGDVTGHLATFTSAEEYDFVVANLPEAFISLEPQTENPYLLGGFQPPNTPNEPAGGWQWVTGEPFIYTNWAPGEPNDDDIPEDCLHIGVGSPGWNDLPCKEHAGGYVVEYPMER